MENIDTFFLSEPVGHGSIYQDLLMLTIKTGDSLRIT
jgi:hypothetical protein